MAEIARRLKLYRWQKPDTHEAVRYICGYCGHLVSSEKGWKLHDGNNKQHGGVFLCPDCDCPTFHYPDESTRIPDSPFGSSISNLPSDINSLYEEARTCTANTCYTAAVLILRKLLMNIAVAQGAAANLRFIDYVNHLEANHFVPPNGRPWVDHIRKKGNEATHEIHHMTREDAKDLIVFIEMLLRFIYEFPAMLSPPSTP